MLTNMLATRTEQPKLAVFPSEILRMILEQAVSSLLPFNSANRRVLASLCRLGWEGYEVAGTHLYHTVILPEGCHHTGHLKSFLNTVTNNPYLAGKVVNLWVGDPELGVSGGNAQIENQPVTNNILVIPQLPNLRRFAINGRNSSVCWRNLAPTHLTVSDLHTFERPIPTLRTLYLINSLLTTTALESVLKGCPALHSVVFEITEPFSKRVDFMTLVQLSILVLKTLPHLRKLTFRIENFWMLHRTTRMLPAKLEEKGLRETLKGKIIATVWSWELGMDFCDIWMANSHRQRVGKEHKICY
ncbi:hypothetical protein CTheo_1632 [Ceratobasidium theobromae]|uniref:F-box-like domain containing protein n=1 Tax=Ceratobasidium theobromae TaxID=1582974 RepID=A0A5N5QTP3_9AGAM|nr:hypothetical protein CTheo_1632 [Ceratobasidium theobromae]